MMPPVKPAERVWAAVQGGSLSASSDLQVVLTYVFATGITLALIRCLLVAVLACIQKRRTSKRTFNPTYLPPVSVVISAYNEAAVIATSVRSVLASTYPDFEVLVMDDGSKDETLEVLHTEFGREPRVRILTQKNSGKAGALNQLIASANHEVVVALDADTLFLPSTLGKLVRHFEDPKVAAVSGNARVGNTTNWLIRFQSIEYVCGFNLDRRALDLMNAATVVPGAVGAWRKSAVLEVGGYAQDTVAEDTDLTLAIRRRGYRITYEDQAVAYTEVPETVSLLVRQRLRWAFGTLQAAWKHRDTTLRTKYGSLGLVTLPNIWLQNAVLASISPLAEVALLISLVFGQFFSTLPFYGALLCIDLATALVAYALEEENPAPLIWLPLQRLVYSQMMLYVVCKSLVFAVGGRAMKWGVQVRTASVSLSTGAQNNLLAGRSDTKELEYRHAEQ
jgi:cellulose synthase/poly-beta-1,6-N-acetylglucosamine synthase-like glycosyltransferase